MKIFAKEIMVGQYKIDGPPYRVDLCFIVHRLLIEVDEEHHIYYDDKENQIRQKLIECFGFIFIRINHDVQNPDVDIEIAKIRRFINELSVRLAINLAEESLK